ncbi:MAG: hypothetical protein ACP5J1_06855 [Fervidicoccaceae archaeon]
MKSFWIVFMLSLIFVGLTAEGITYPRQVDPSKVKEEWDPLLLIPLFSSFSNSVYTGNYAAAQENITNILISYLPESYRNVLERGASLMQQLLGQLNQTEALINQTETSINQSMFPEARKAISEARVQLSYANITYVSLLDAISVLPLGANRLSQSLSGIAEKIQLLSLTLNELEKIANSEPFIETTISITAEPLVVRWGHYLEIKGRLSASGGDPLPGRTVEVHVGDLIISTVTGEGGYYDIAYNITSYSPQLAVYAEYIPVGDDVFTYRYSKSDILNVSVIYVTPKISVNLNGTSYLPGETIMLKITSYIQTEVPFSVISAIGNYTGILYNETEVNLKVPSYIEDGVYTINVITPPVGDIAPFVWSTNLTVHRLNLSLSFVLPQRLISGKTYIMNVETPVPCNLSVSSSAGEAKVEGSTIILQVPLLYFGKSMNVIILAVPADPSYSPVIITSSAEVINPIPIAVSITLGAVALLYIAKKLLAVSKEIAAPKLPSIPLRTEEEEGSVMGGIYSQIRKLYGIRMEPWMTYREYLNKLAERAEEEIVYLLKDILYKLERFLYGGREYSSLLRVAEERARLLYRKLKSMIGGKK